MNDPVIPATYRQLIESGRVSAGTRDMLLARAKPDDAEYRPAVLSPEALATLRAVMECVVPQPADAFIDIAARIDAQLDGGQGDGWRYDDLPPDAEAYRAGLQTLDGVSEAEHGKAFASLDAEARRRILEHVAGGRLDTQASPLNGRQMRLWFEEVRGDAVRIYVSHPATLARMGYSGIAYGGDSARKPGFTHTGLGEREAWEPAAPNLVTREPAP